MSPRQHWQRVDDFGGDDGDRVVMRMVMPVAISEVMRVALCWDGGCFRVIVSVSRYRYCQWGWSCVYVGIESMY